MAGSEEVFKRIRTEKLERLNKYLDGLKQRLSGTVPPKHASRPDIFKQMIQADIDRTMRSIESLNK